MRGMVKIMMIFIMGISLVQASFLFDNSDLPKVSTTTSTTTTTTTINNTNSSDYWDNLDTPSDISGSEFWINHTSTVFTLWDTRWLDDTDTTCSADQSCGNILYLSDLPLENQTIVSCANVTGAVSDLCTVTPGGGGADGNASSICASNQVLLGNGTCRSDADYFDDTDTNRSDADILGVCTVYNETSWVLAQSYLTSETDPIYSAWDKDYNDLINKPSIPVIWDATFNTTGDARWLDGAGNSSWNQSYADTLYDPISTSGNTVFKFSGSKFMIKVT